MNTSPTHDTPEHAGQAALPRQEGRKKCVLIYEDNQEILFLCKRLLENDNYRVETLSRCENVISDINRLQPDLVLMDLWIPEIGGEKAIALMKENMATAPIPVLLFSANSDIKAICLKIKADGFIAKPFDIAELKAIIARYI